MIGESISDILDDGVKKYFKKEIDAEYENIEKTDQRKYWKKMILIKKVPSFGIF
ncbi:hypothetical protein HYD61_02440 [Mycoplasmopsis bovis]|nr:hypothetical protein [Mycoplasmopsis bovis]QQH60605.1 hypothetical protein HYD61_02440 [Mycoplasmopsis bovis]